jgi:hypothetical protein
MRYRSTPVIALLLLPGTVPGTIEPQNAFGGPDTVLALFVEVDGQRLVDEVIAFFEADTFS